MAHQQINLQSLTSEELSENQEKILDIVESALHTSSGASIDDVATFAAAELETMAIQHSAGTTIARSFFEDFWELLPFIARRIPHQHPWQTLLVKITLKLDASDRGNRAVCDLLQSSAKSE